MLYYYDNLLHGMDGKTDYDRLVTKLRAGHPTYSTWVLTLSSNPNEQLDLMQALLLLQPYYKEHDVYIIAVVAGEKDGIDVIKDITEAEVRQFDRVDFRARFPKEVFSP